MAIDNASKRYSMLNFGRKDATPSFVPDGTVDAGDMYHLLGLYFGITLTQSKTWSEVSIDATSWSATTADSSTWTEIPAAT